MRLSVRTYVAITMVLYLFLSMSGIATAVTITVTTIPLSGTPLDLDVSGNVVAYTDEVSHDNNVMRYYDLGTGANPGLNTAPSTRDNPTVDGNLMVWAEGGGAGLIIYDINAPVHDGTPIAGSGTYSFYPALSGSILAWLAYDFGDGQSSVWYQNLGAASVQVTNELDGFGAASPDVSGNYIVWSQTVLGVTDVYLYNVAAPVFGGTAIAGGAGAQSYPRISGSRVVYSDNADGDEEIYLYTIGGSPAQKITDNTAQDTLPDISGNYIVWLQDGQVCLYNMTDGSTTQLTSGADQYAHLRIEGNHIVWLDTPVEGPATAYLATIQEATTQLPYTGR